MSFFRKDKSWVNRIIFPAPKPASYDANSFDRYDPYHGGRLIWVPRKQAAVRRHTEVHDKNSVPCLVYECPNKGAKKILLFCHGNSEDLGNSPGILQRMRNTMNFHVIGIEYPGYGISEGEPSESGLNNDVLVVYSFLTGVLEWPADQIVVFGFSIGTGPSTHLAATREVGGLILVAPYTSIRSMVQCVLPKGVGKFAQYLISNRFNNLEEVRKVSCPTLIIHGKADQLIPYEHSKQIYDNCGAKQKKIYLAENLDHCFNDDDFEAYILFPLVSFFEFKREAGRTLDLPKYVMTKPDGTILDEVKSSSRVSDDLVLAEDDDLANEPEWPCQQCTYVNAGRRKQCQMCLAPKPVSVKQWNCETCTFLNMYQPDACEMCGAPNPASLKVKPAKKEVATGSEPPVPTLKRDGSIKKLAQIYSDELDALTAADTPWSCSACKQANDRHVVVCVACGNARESQA